MNVDSEIITVGIPLIIALLAVFLGPIIQFFISERRYQSAARRSLVCCIGLLGRESSTSFTIDDSHDPIRVLKDNRLPNCTPSALGWEFIATRTNSIESNRLTNLMTESRAWLIQLKMKVCQHQRIPRSYGWLTVSFPLASGYLNDSIYRNSHN